MSAPEDFCHNCIVAGYKKFKTVCGHQRYCLECRSSVTKPIRRPRSSGRPSILLDNSVLCKVCSELVELVDDDPKKPNRDPPQPLVICGRDFRTKSEVVPVQVGPEGGKKTLFNIHSHILAHIPFFATGLNGAFIEGRTKQFESFENDPIIFGMVVEYLYTGSISTSSPKGPGLSSPTMEQYFRLWILGDYLMFPALQDYCAYCLVRGCDEGIVISPKALAELYDAAPQLGHTHTAMARFIVDTIVWYDVDIELLVNPTPRLLKAVISQLQARGNRRLMNPFLDVRNWYVGVKEDDMKEMVTDTYGVGKIGTPEWERMQDTAGLP